jgi:hypothetical protein
MKDMRLAGITVLASVLVSTATLFAQPLKVEIRKVDDRFQLYRNGEPYYVNGAGGFSHFDKLKEYGGNSIRMWTSDGADKVLDQAQQLGLTVTVGLYLTPVHYGMNYSDPVALKEQKERVRKEVMKYKDHPALLMWGVGNEVGLIKYDKAMFLALQDIAKMIHEIDPNHPTTTMLAGAPVKQIRMIKRHCPDIDLISINAFKEVPWIYEKIHRAGWKKPYMVSEFGPTGYWETTTTSWGAFIEETSSQKAKACAYRYQAIKDQKHCVGCYLFLWGHKQERTNTLFSLILESGHETETLDAMEEMWKGKSHTNLAPIVIKATIDNKTGSDNIRLKLDKNYTATVTVKDPENEELTYYWELLHETAEKRLGASEVKPDWVPDRVKENNKPIIQFQAPGKPGAYRLFVYAYDNHNHVATANIPFLVEK